MREEKREPRSTWTWTMPTPGKGYNWNWEKRHELMTLLAAVESGDGGMLTISYKSNALMPIKDEKHKS